ncbi:GNAT family N-acetyltransferase [Streptomyces sp. NPDC002644]
MNRPLPAVRLRVPTEEDAVAWHALFDDPEVMEFFGGKPAPLAAYERATARQRDYAERYGFCLWSVLDEDDRVMGFVGAQPWGQDWGPDAEQIEVAWRMGRAYWGRGYVTAAAVETLERIREAGVGTVIAMVDAENARSVAVTRRLGMEFAEGLVAPETGRDWNMYRLDLA